MGCTTHTQQSNFIFFKIIVEEKNILKLVKCVTHKLTTIFQMKNSKDATSFIMSIYKMVLIFRLDFYVAHKYL